MYKLCDNLLERKIKQTKSDQRFFKGIAIFVLLLSVIVVLNTYVFFTVLVDGGSMRPTLSSGDVLIVNRYKKFERGDIVVINDGSKDAHGNDKLIIKRVIATELDTVEIIDGVVKVNGRVLEEDYIPAGYSNAEDDVAFFTVPRGKVFYLGDNRWNSSDSRIKGPCDQNQIIGVVEPWSLSMRQINKIFFNLGSYIRGGD